MATLWARCFMIAESTFLVGGGNEDLCLESACLTGGVGVLLEIADRGADLTVEDGAVSVPNAMVSSALLEC